MKIAEGPKRHTLSFIHLLMVVCAFLASTSFTVGKAIAHGMDPVVLTFFRFILATFLLFFFVRGRCPLFPGWPLILRCSVISLSLVVFFWCMFSALRYTTALHTSILFTLVPSIAGFYALLLVREQLTREIFLGLVCGIAGAIWVIFKGDIADFFTLQWNRGDLIFLGGCLAMGFYTPLVRLFHRGEPMLLMTFWILATGTVWLFLISIPRFALVSYTETAAVIWMGIAYLAVFTTVITFFLTQYSIPYLGPTRVMAYSYLYPTLVLFLDLVCGNGWPGIKVLPGIIIVLAAMLVIQRSGKS